MQWHQLPPEMSTGCLMHMAGWSAGIEWRSSKGVAVGGVCPADTRLQETDNTNTRLFMREVEVSRTVQFTRCWIPAGPHRPTSRKITTQISGVGEISNTLRSPIPPRKASIRGVPHGGPQRSSVSRYILRFVRNLGPPHFH